MVSCDKEALRSQHTAPEPVVQQRANTEAQSTQLQHDGATVLPGSMFVTAILLVFLYSI